MSPLRTPGSLMTRGADGPLPPLLLMMTFVTGLVDAFAYLVLGHVFVANMTGNVVFLGFALAQAPASRSSRRPSRSSRSWWARPSAEGPARCSLIIERDFSPSAR